MPDNKTEPLSLRAMGSFTVCGSEVYADCKELPNWDINELEQCVETFLQHFYETIQASTVDIFYVNMENSPYHKELRKSLSLIQCGKYKEALAYLSDKGRGYFCNENICVNEAMREHCKIRLLKE